MIIPVIVICLAGSAYVAGRKRAKGAFTAERVKIYQAAVSGALKDPDKLDKLAEAFDREKLPEQAKILRQRAALRRLPPEIKKARRAAFQAALASTNKVGVLAMAAVYDSQGCTTAALRLRQYGGALPDVIPEPAPPQTTMQGEEELEAEAALDSAFDPEADETELEEALADAIEEPAAAEAMAEAAPAETAPPVETPTVEAPVETVEAAVVEVVPPKRSKRDRRPEQPAN